MFAIDDPTAVAVLPTPEAPGTPGFFTEGNPALGQAATYVRASWLNSLQQELLNVLAGAGITPSKTAYDQILKALRSNALIVATDTGAANAAVLTYSPAVTLTDGMVLWFKAKATNTGATTLNVNGLGASPVVGAGHAALQGGEIVANGKCQVVWNATLSSWVLIECTGAALQVGPAVASGQAVQLAQLNGSVGSTAGGTIRFPFVDAGGVKRTLLINYGLLGIACTTTGTVGYYGSATITWPSAFPNSVLAIMLSSQDQVASAPYLTTWQSATLTGCTIMPHASGSVGNINCMYLAIGF